jgi:hypothetical protein
MGPQYTSCVEANDYVGLNKAWLLVLVAAAVIGGFAAAITGGLSALISAAAFFEALRYVLDWLLHGKLICLHRGPSEADCICSGPDGITVCALGEIVDTEDVGQDKNPIEDLDDDYAINLALLPFSMGEFASKGFVERNANVLGTESDEFDDYKQSLFQIATKPGQPQGDLVTRQQGKDGLAKEFGYLRTMVMLSNGEYFPWPQIVGRDSGTPLLGPDEHKAWLDYVAANAWLFPKKFSVPVLHCEFEGSRTHDMLNALEGFPFGSSFCKKNFFTKLLCKVLAALLAPILLAALALAWLRNTAGSTAPALVGGGTIGPRDKVIVRGSWVYDAGHSGWNEMHAVRIVQRAENVPNDPTAFKAFLHLWCERMGETPTDGGDVAGTPGKPQDVPAAGITFTAQQMPENKWEFHPAVDGCQPVDDRPLPPIH